MSLLQVKVHKQRQRDLSSMAKSLEETIEISQHLHCWQNLLTAHSLELAELINNLDEEAAADIRKVLLYQDVIRWKLESIYKNKLDFF